MAAPHSGARVPALFGGRDSKMSPRQSEVHVWNDTGFHRFRNYEKDRQMTEYILFAVAFWCWCVLFFILIQKPLFLFLNRENCPEKITFSSYLQVIRHGFVSDAIVASYLCAVPLILGLIHFLFPSSNLSAMMLPYNILAAPAVAIISLGDAVLYSFWSSKIESSIFIYLRHPKNVIASVSTGYVLTALVS